MQSMDVGEHEWIIMVWDLSPQSAKYIHNLVEIGGAPLRRYACKIASFDPSNESGRPHFKDAERVTWDLEYGSPC